MSVFPLEPVLQHREHLEQEAQRTLAQATQRVSEAEAEVRACVEARGALARQWRREAEQMVSITRQELFAAWRQELRRQEAESVARAAEARRVLEAARQALILAHREHRKVQHLRERAWRDHLSKLARAERLFLDDLTVMRHGRHVASPALHPQQEAR